MNPNTEAPLPPGMEAAADGDPVADDADDGYEITAWWPKHPFDHVVRFVAGLITRSKILLLYVFLLALTYGWLRPLLPDLSTRVGLLLTAAAVLPVLAVLLVVLFVDRTSLEPFDLVLRTFLAGMGMAVLAVMLNTQLSYLEGAAFDLIVVGPGEELLKLLAVFLIAYRHKAFDHAIDGAFYGAAAGAGFAAIENVSKVVQASALAGTGAAWDLVLLRSFVSTPGHVIWTAIAGYYLGVAKFHPKHATVLLTKGLLIAALAHGAFNVLVASARPEAVAVAVALNLALLVFLVVKARRWFAYYGLLGEGAAAEPADPTARDLEREARGP